MEVDVYGRVVCTDDISFEFLRSMLSSDPDKPMFEDEVATELLPVFEVLEFVDAPDSQLIDIDSLTIDCHWFVSDTSEATALVSGLAKAGLKALYAVIWLDVEQLKLLILDEEGSRVFSAPWSGQTWEALNDADCDMFSVLADIQKHGVQL